MSHPAVNLKDTVLTPKTDFPMKADLTTREPQTLARWADSGQYAAIRARVAARRAAGEEVPLFVLHDGPPYANGDAHTGTGMNKILKDFVVKFRTMQGFDSPYIPGWDCHGLPIEHKVLEELGGQKPADMTALEVRRRCRAFAESFIGKQREQFKRTFTLGRWEKPYLTIDPVYEGGVLDCFSELMEKGLIRREKKPVHWSWAAQSALAEAELEYEDRTDPSIYVKFPVRTAFEPELDDTWRFGDLPESFFAKFCNGEKGLGDGDDAVTIAQRKRGAEARLGHLRELVGKRALHLVIWTTTPWTLPANLAVVVSRSAEYGLYQVGEEVWVMACDLAVGVLEKAGLKERKPLGVFTGGELLGLLYSHPMWGTPCMVFPADYVTLEDGTGLVHTAPGHGAEDFYTGKEYGLPAVCPVDERGCYYKGEALVEQLELNGKELGENAKSWLALLSGQHILKANKLIIQKMETDKQPSGQPLMVHWHEFTHSYPHCWRTHKPVIFRATEQWFVSIDGDMGGQTLRERIVGEIGKSEWFPAWGKNRITGMVSNRPDWCISRQRYWGIPIPAFMDPASGKVCADTTVAKCIAEVVREHGSDVWYDEVNWPVEKLLPDQFRPTEFRGKSLARMNDIFDVWFESGSSHRGVTAAEAELQGPTWDGKSFRPADLYLEGDDQHRGWFQVSLILSTATKGVSPFRQCLTSAFVVDEKGEKGSKSKGNIFAIDWGCNQVGADLLRLYFAAADTSSPIPVTLDLVRDKTSGPYRTLRNTIRVLLGNLHGFDPVTQSVEESRMLEIDRWMLSRLAFCIQDMTAAWERYEFHVATRRFVDFCNLEVSAFYVDVTKDRMYCHGRDSHVRRSGLTAMHRLVSAMIRLLAPVCPHTADEAWAHLPGRTEDEWSVFLAREGWPSASSYPRDVDLEDKFDRVFQIREAVERVMDVMRKDKSLKNSTAARVTLHAATAEWAEFLAAGMRLPELATCLSVSEVVAVGSAPAGAHSAPEAPGLNFTVEPSPHEKCERCWNHWESVAPRAKAGGAKLCDRCTGVVGG